MHAHGTAHKHEDILRTGGGERLTPRVVRRPFVSIGFRPGNNPSRSFKGDMLNDVELHSYSAVKMYSLQGGIKYNPFVRVPSQ